MFSLKSFLQAIQGAILAADDALKQKNLDVLNTYFEKDVDDQEIRKRIDQSLSSTEEVLNSDSTVSRQALEGVMESLKELKGSLSQPDAIDQALAGEDLRPKTVILSYPSIDKDGSVKDKEVHVPLVTLVPVTFSKIEELRLKTYLELNVQDGEIQVGLGKFSNKGAADGETTQSGGTGNKSSIGSIEIIIKPQQMSDGMQHVVDAYEKTLKAQLPH